MAEKLGLKNNARNPGSIVNIQHHDVSGAQKNLQGDSGQFSLIIPDSSVATPLQDEAVLRISNSTGTIAYVFIGREDQVPGGALTIANAMVLQGLTTLNFFAGNSDDPSKSLVVKTSTSTVQVVVLK